MLNSWAIGLMLGVYVAGDSGGYLNPAVTLTNCLFRKLPWRRFPIYFLAQFLGGFIGAGVVYANYVSAIDNYEGHGVRTVPPSPTATAGIFATYPQGFLPIASMFFSEFIGSAILMFVIFALKDESNIGAGKLFPLGLFFLMFGLGACFGFETGYALNFARDFGPRLMTYALGYGGEVWSANRYYFWVRYNIMGPSVAHLNRHRTMLIVKISGPYDCPFSRLYLWRFPLRHIHLYRRKLSQYLHLNLY